MRKGGPAGAQLARNLDEAFPELVRAHERAVFSIALRYTGCREDAADIAQETFVRAHRALSDYDVERIVSLRVRPWLWAIAANCCRNHSRARSRRPQTSAASADVVQSREPEPSEMLELADALDTLPGPQRMAVVMRHVAGIPIAEIAAALDRPTGTVKSDIHRGLAKLRETLRETTEEP